MLGAKNSGKTTYMVSSFGVLQNPTFGFSVGAVKSDDKDWFGKLYDIIRSGNYPDATDKHKSYAMNLLYNYTKTMTFDWLDVAGGLIKQTVDGKNVLVSELQTSDGLMVFFDSKALLDRDIEATQLSATLRIILSELMKRETHYFVSIVLTKYDTIPAGKSLSQILGIDLTHFLDNFKNSNNIKICITPVSCFGKTMVNVDYPLLFQLKQGLEIEHQRLSEESKRLYDGYSDAQRKYKRLKRETEDLSEREDSEWKKYRDYESKDTLYDRFTTKLGNLLGGDEKTYREMADETHDKWHPLYKKMQKKQKKAEDQANSASELYNRHLETVKMVKNALQHAQKLDEYLDNYKLAIPPPTIPGKYAAYADKFFELTEEHLATENNLYSSDNRNKFDI